MQLSEHSALAEERRKVWQRTTKLIDDYLTALLIARHCAAAREKAKSSARELLNLTKPSAELSSVAKWCILLRNNLQLSKLVG